MAYGPWCLERAVKRNHWFTLEFMPWFTILLPQENMNGWWIYSQYNFCSFLVMASQPAVGRLTHWGRVSHKCVGKLTIIGSDNGLSPGRRQANQWWNIVNWTPGNKLQWILHGNWYIFIQENAFENVVCEMAYILSRPQCVKNKLKIIFVQGTVASCYN